MNKGGIKRSPDGLMSGERPSCTKKANILEIAPMWQRIQTLYMFLAAMAVVVFGTQGLSNTESIIGGLAAASFLASISYYKPRQRQFVINRLGMISVLILFGIVVMPSLRDGTWSNDLTLPALSTLAALVFGSLANRAIQKDEARVNASESFRKK